MQPVAPGHCSVRLMARCTNIQFHVQVDASLRSACKTQLSALGNQLHMQINGFSKLIAALRQDTLLVNDGWALRMRIKVYFRSISA